MTNAHIVAIRERGKLVAYQLRRGRGGPGDTAYFPVKAHGGPDNAHAAALEEARAHDLTVGSSGRGGSPKGRRTRLSPTSAAGIRWEWRPYYGGSALVVIATWTDKTGRPRSTSYSTERNGLDGALDKAIAARTSAGAPQPDRAALLSELRIEKLTGAPL